LLSTVCTASRFFPPPFFPTPLPNQWAEGVQEVGRGQSWDSWLEPTQGLLQTIMMFSAIKAQGMEETRGNVHGYGICLPKLQVLKPCLPGNG